MNTIAISPPWNKRLNVILFLILTLTIMGIGCSDVDNKNTLGPERSTHTCSDDIWTNISDAYTFTFPLMMMDATMKTSTNSETTTDRQAPVNQLIHMKRLANAKDRLVVTPNVDTIYSLAFFELSRDALVLRKPTTERYCSMAVFDAYTNCAAMLGTGGDTQDERIYLITGPDFSGEAPANLKRVSIPTNNAWMIVRTIVKDEEDLDNVYAIQTEMKLVPLKAYMKDGFDYTPPKGEFREENNFIPVQHVLAMRPQEYFSAANELMAVNPPVPEDAAILERMAKINVGPGLLFEASILGCCAEQEWKAMIKGMRDKWLKDSAQFMQKMGSWDYWGNPIAAFGTEYTYRALVALDGLGANPTSVAIYPKAETDNAGAPLDGKNAYTIRFDDPSPAGEYGFWSVTAYGKDNFLIDNEINRYSINDRSGVKYNADGSLDILLQPLPPEDKTLMGNWLPVKAEPFHLYLRIYLPKSRVISGEWPVPVIRPQ